MRSSEGADHDGDLSERSRISFCRGVGQSGPPTVLSFILAESKSNLLSALWAAGIRKSMSLGPTLVVAQGVTWITASGINGRRMSRAG